MTSTLEYNLTIKDPNILGRIVCKQCIDFGFGNSAIRFATYDFLLVFHCN